MSGGRRSRARHVAYTIRSAWPGAAALAAVLAGPGVPARADQAPTPLDVIPPPMSAATSSYFRANPGALADLMAGMPRRDAAAPAQALAGLPPGGGTWQTVKTVAPGYLSNPLLLTDGTVIAENTDAPQWYKLTPDSKGSYVNGTWSKIASLPVINGVQYAPLYHASAVLPDGRVIIMGGEYNNSNDESWTKLGAIYDPLANKWTPVPAPSGWTRIGDAQSSMLANGTFLLASCCSDPAADALFNAKALTWTKTGAPTAGDNYQDEQGYELLPSGNVLTIDLWTHYNTGGGATNTEQYRPASGTWANGGNTPKPLGDPAKCGTWEIGPAALRPSGSLVAFGGNTGCVAGATSDPTALLKTSTGVWTAGPNIPAVCGTNGKTSCSLADAPAAVLPDGNILFAASAGYPQAPTHFFEYTAANTIFQVADTKYFAAQSADYYYNFLVLPTGQILSTDFTNTPEIYTPVGTPVAGSAPVIETSPSSVTRGTSYKITGKQLSGLSQGSYYGDDVQGATNYPIVRVTNTATGRVTYARTSNPSTMSVAPNTYGTVNFVLPSGASTGAGKLVVVANGVASQAVSVVVK